jgi:hypothetical protein
VFPRQYYIMGRTSVHCLYYTTLQLAVFFCYPASLHLRPLTVPTLEYRLWNPRHCAIYGAPTLFVFSFDSKRARPMVYHFDDILTFRYFSSFMYINFFPFPFRSRVSFTSLATVALSHFSNHRAHKLHPNRLPYPACVLKRWLGNES